jgi:NAD(P)-dependent dehydrogenase (short-subunit alcohol dehydrogenase family)
MTYKPFDLSGKVCVVTGGNKGIGLGLVVALAASNADVVIWGRKADDNTAAVNSASKLGTGKVKAWAVDVGEEDQVVKAMKEAEEEFKRIDTCIANAGVGRGSAGFENMTLDTWRYNQRINSEGAFFTLREAAKSMVARAKAGDPGGSLVGTASLAGIEGAGRNQAYAHTKGGLIAMMNACAVEYGRYGIRANSVLPGWIATDMTEGAQGNDAFATKVITRVPIRRWGEPADFGGIAVYLASDASKYHSGDTLVIDGGYAKF